MYGFNYERWDLNMFNVISESLFWLSVFSMLKKYVDRFAEGVSC